MELFGEELFTLWNDKGSGTVVMDKSWDIDEGNRQLNDAKFYRELDGDITDTIQQRVTVYIERMFNDGYIDEKTRKYLVQTWNQDVFTYYLKYIKREILDVP